MQDLGLATLRWIDRNNVSHYRVYAQSPNSSRPRISEDCLLERVCGAPNRIEHLLKPNRTYLGLATNSASNSTFFDQKAYVPFDYGNDPQVEEWQVSANGRLNIAKQNGPWRLSRSSSHSTGIMLISQVKMHHTTGLMYLEQCTLLCIYHIRGGMTELSEKDVV